MKDKYDVIVIAAGMTVKPLTGLSTTCARTGVCYSFDVGTIMSHLLSGLLMTIGRIINKWMS